MPNAMHNINAQWFLVSKSEKVYKPTNVCNVCMLELVSKELNHLAAILHVYAGGLNFMK